MKQMSADVGWAEQIKKSLKDDSFVLLYQPIVDIQTGHPVMYEVLLRMRSDGSRLIPPAAFLPAANRFGLMPEIDQWVIRNALGKLKEFQETHQDIRFALNISGNIFEDTNLYRRIGETLADNNLPPDSLVLEITEQIAVRDIVTAAKQIKEIRKLGCKFAIDDFGSGHSSYTYLKGLPVDYIKIDGSFIQNLTSDVIDRTIVSSIAQIAQGTGKQTIAEHVENSATMDLLRELGVDYAQGFYVGKPFAKD
jgi:EAL domain-containing protein (putative c-di-GMP-specific phosphodiesterase class I)